MWHRVAKIGVNELDMDHVNIDYIIHAISSGCEDESMGEKLIPAFLAHMKHEEKTIERMGREFPSDHKKEHMWMTTVLCSSESDWKEKKISTCQLAREIKALLVLHVLDFDIKLIRDTEKFQP